jgi:hypothetical protein
LEFWFVSIRCNRAALQPHWLLPIEAQALLEQIGSSRTDVKSVYIFLCRSQFFFIPNSYWAVLKQSFLCVSQFVKAGCVIYTKLLLIPLASGGAGGWSLELFRVFFVQKATAFSTITSHLTFFV